MWSMPVVLTETENENDSHDDCKNNVGASPRNIVDRRHYFYE